LFAELLPEPVTWFADRELSTWSVVLEQIGFPDAEEMIRETSAAGDVDLVTLDHSGVVTMARDLGLLETAAGQDAFLRSGIELDVAAGA
jgi:hypothetical protein